MAAKSLSEEQLNFFKFTLLVFEEFPKVLRRIFVIMWDSTVASKPGFPVWYDSTKVRNMFLTSEGGNTVVPTAKSIEEWDCTALFAATIYAKTFGHSGLNLNDLYLKKVRPVTGSFHKSVQGSTGDPMETYALAIDQLRLLRNTLCHSSNYKMIESDFDDYILLLKNTLQAINFDSTCVDDISRMSEDNYPMERVPELKEFQKKLQATFEENCQKLCSIDKKSEFLVQKLSVIEVKQDAEWKVLSDIHTMVRSIKEEKGNASG